MSLIQNLFAWFEKNLSVSPAVAQLVTFIIYLVIIAALFVFFRFFLLKLLHSIIRKTKTMLDDALVNFKVISRAFNIIPLMIIYNSADLFPQLSVLLTALTKILIIWEIALIISAFLNAINFLYNRSKRSKNRPIKGYLQIISIFFFVLAAVASIAIVMGKSPWILLSSLGAMTAVILFIFKDTILSLLASFQITFNDLIRMGDWLDIPQFNADGNVIDIALHTIKVQNWDKTISVIPTHKLMEGSFKNWKGMEMSGGRRIKRAIHIDMSSIRFLDQRMMDNLQQILILKPYFSRKIEDISNYNQRLNIPEDDVINGRKLTNIGTFRAYIEAYLKNNANIKQDMTLIVRQLEPTEKGLPIEIYAFSSDIRWANYEAIQADIFDHLLAVINSFDLRVFQLPSGTDLKNIIK